MEAASLSDAGQEINLRLQLDCEYLIDTKATIASRFQLHPVTDNLISQFIGMYNITKQWGSHLFFYLLKAYISNITGPPNVPVSMKVYNFYLFLDSTSRRTLYYVPANLDGIALRENSETWICFEQKKTPDSNMIEDRVVKFLEMA